MAHHFLFPMATILVTLLFSPSSTATNSPVLDIDRNPLEVGSQYYVLASGTGTTTRRGGLTYAPRCPNLCPNYVGQIEDWAQSGMPVSFYPSNSSQKHINLGDDVNIVFSGPNFCGNSGVWNLSFDQKVPYIATNGVAGNHGPQTVGNWFKIVWPFQHGFGYALLYCFIRPAPPFPNIIGGEDGLDCKQLDALQLGPDVVSFLTLVDRNKFLPFMGFAFKKIATSPTAALY